MLAQAAQGRPAGRRRKPPIPSDESSGFADARFQANHRPRQRAGAQSPALCPFTSNAPPPKPQIPSTIRSTSVSTLRPNATAHRSTRSSSTPGNERTRIVQRRSTRIAYGNFRSPALRVVPRLPPGSTQAATPSSAEIARNRFCSEKSSAAGMSINRRSDAVRWRVPPLPRSRSTI